MPSGSHKEVAMDFLRLIVAGDIREAYRKYTGPDFRHHFPYSRGDAESLMAAMEADAAANPEKVVEFQRALQEGDLVAVHSWIQQKPTEPGAAVVHLFRFEGELIAEFWGIGELLPEESPNENGPF